MLAHCVVAAVPKQPELVINAPTSPVTELFNPLVIELMLVKLVTLFSAPLVIDPGLVIAVDRKLAIGVPDNDRPEVDGTLYEIPVAALTADTVCRPLCV